MINLVVLIKSAAHIAATKAAIYQARDDFREDTLTPKVRKLALSFLVESGFPAFLLNEQGLMPLCHGTTWSTPGESKTDWILYSRKEADAYIAAFELNIWGDDDIYNFPGLCRSYGGPGRWFREAPDIMVGRNHVLLKSFAGMDI